ncbi:MAG: lytic transglycosylase domain-containing protein [Nitrospirae bacterium]|nr:lytic transglycosylase domain-containing protein [Nitrospirota bacterium]
MGKVFLALPLILFFFTIAQADIYKYIDESGVIYYTDIPSVKKANRVIKEKTKDSSTDSRSAKSVSASKSYYNSIIHDKAAIYHLDPSLIKAVIKTESNWNCRAVSRKGAMGLMQLMPATAVEMNVHDPFDPEENIEGGTKYLRYLLERFNGDLTLALAAYNAGPNTVEKFGYIPPITETKQYVSRVLSLYNGTTTYPSAGSGSMKNTKKPEPIYKITLEDGTILFTNSYLFTNNPVRF